MEDRNRTIVIVVLAVTCLVLGIGFGRAYYGIPDATNKFETNGITVHYGKPNSMLYAHKLHISGVDNFYFFVEEYDITEVWIKRGAPPYYYFVKDEVMYWW